MDLVQIVVVLVIIGVILWLINQYIPMSPPIKTVINVLVILFLCLWLLRISGIMGTLYIGPKGVR